MAPNGAPPPYGPFWTASERYYAVLVDEQTYLKQATSGFLSQHYKNSLFRLVSTLADGRLSQEELQNLEDIVSKLEE